MKGAPKTELTPREREIRELLNEGLKNSEIAAEAGCAMGTVKIHIRNISKKLGANPRGEQNKIRWLQKLRELRTKVNEKIAQLEIELDATHHE